MRILVVEDDWLLNNTAFLNAYELNKQNER